MRPSLYRYTEVDKAEVDLHRSVNVWHLGLTIKFD